MKRDEARAYLAGIFDGEGSVNLGARHRGLTRKGDPKDNQTRHLSISNTDWLIIEAAREALAVLGIEVHLGATTQTSALGTKAVWTLRISGQLNLRNFYAVVPLRSVKKERLALALSTYVKKPYVESLRLVQEAGA